jgi:molybdopterin-binding protein
MPVTGAGLRPVVHWEAYLGNPQSDEAKSTRRRESRWPMEGHMKLSARNVLKGTVKSVIHGAVNSEVVLEVQGGAELVSIITKQSAEDLKLAPGSKAYAVIKASNVMIAVD